MRWHAVAGDRWYRDWPGSHRADVWVHLSSIGYEVSVYMKPAHVALGQWTVIHVTPTLEEAQAYADLKFGRSKNDCYESRFVYPTPAVDAVGDSLEDQGRGDACDD